VAALSRKSGNPKRMVTESDVITARAELAKQGYLVRHAAMRSEGTCTAAAPIKSRGVTVASIGVGGPSQRWDEARAKPFGKLFRQVASELSALLSGT
jgi:DNA-binding IclR family transcriptional regulator